MIVRRGAVLVALVVGLGLSWLAVRHVGVEATTDALVRASPAWVLVGLALMGLSLVGRSVAWRAILRAALPGARIRRRDVLRGTAVGVLLSAVLPARLGEPARALVVSDGIGGRRRDVLPTVVGTIVSQALLNVLALALLGVVTVVSIGLAGGHEGPLAGVVVAPAALIGVVLAAPRLLRRGTRSRHPRVRAAAAVVRSTLTRVRDGLRVFRAPRAAAVAAGAQLLSWAIQTASCYALLVALGLDDRAGLAAAAAVLFAVNVTAAVPVTPSNVGVFQAACVAVLTAGFGVPYAEALAYGVILQAVEVATALALGVPALVVTGSGLIGDLRGTSGPERVPGRVGESSR